MIKSEKKKGKEPSDNERALAAEVRKDFEKRREARSPYERQWQLNANFYLGNQYCKIGASGLIEEEEPDYFWQSREVYNHVAAIYETRAAKLGKVRPRLAVRPATNDESDINTAKASTKILNATQESCELDKRLSDATLWSELTGTCVYKVVWDTEAGREIKDGVCEGDVKIEVCPPYEIFPDSPFHAEIADCKSIMHVRAVKTEEIAKQWGKTVSAERTLLMRLDNMYGAGADGVQSESPLFSAVDSDDCALVIERYTAPTAQLPNGELVIVAGEAVLFKGDLPYVIGSDGKRGYPFVKQVSIAVAGCFFGKSMIERTIPLQRAYNAVKNRKHELINRLSAGVLTVEDGSLDTDDLQDGGLPPGKVLVYRQGANPPRFMDAGSVPSAFESEEYNLLNEFTTISGVSELMRSSNVPSTVTSGVALQLLADQDDTRLSLSGEYIRFAARDIAKIILRLYKQFCDWPRVTRYVGDSGAVENFCWTRSSISSDDVVFESDNELANGTAARQELMFELYRMGIMSDESGKISDAVRRRFLDSLGFGSWDADMNMTRLQAARAQSENVEVKFDISEFDDHETHITEHVRYLLSDCPKRQKNALTEHIKEHQRYARLIESAKSVAVTDESQEGENA